MPAPGSDRIPVELLQILTQYGEDNGNPFQRSCLENPRALGPPRRERPKELLGAA